MVNLLSTALISSKILQDVVLCSGQSECQTLTFHVWVISGFACSKLGSSIFRYISNAYK